MEFKEKGMRMYVCTRQKNNGKDNVKRYKSILGPQCDLLGMVMVCERVLMIQYVSFCALT